MNYLAHLYLSGKNEDILIGNFIADSVKGSKYKNYPTEIQRGVVLHRQIDTHTDAHPNFRTSTKRFLVMTLTSLESNSSHNKAPYSVLTNTSCRIQIETYPQHLVF